MVDARAGYIAGGYPRGSRAQPRELSREERRRTQGAGERDSGSGAWGPGRVAIFLNSFARVVISGVT